MAFQFNSQPRAVLTTQQQQQLQARSIYRDVKPSPSAQPGTHTEYELLLPLKGTSYIFLVSSRHFPAAMATTAPMSGGADAAYAWVADRDSHANIMFDPRVVRGITTGRPRQILTRVKVRNGSKQFWLCRCC